MSLTLPLPFFKKHSLSFQRRSLVSISSSKRVTHFPSQQHFIVMSAVAR